MRVVCSAFPYCWVSFRYRLLLFWGPAMIYFGEHADGALCVHYTSEPWDLWDEPSDCDWFIPGTLDLGGQQ